MNTATSSDIHQAYRLCQRTARRHYENFPVASLLLPASIRPAVAVIYTFARQADDIADEGQHSASERLAQLDGFDQGLKQLAASQPPNAPLWLALADTIQRYQLPLQLFHDLISAFRQDVTITRYQTDDDVLDYCRHSANPIGRLLLHLSQQATEDNLRDSDRVCSALQLINFLQDLAQDYDENDRIYIPRSVMHRFHVEEDHFRNRVNDVAMRQLIADRVRYARRLLLAGAALGWRLPGRLGYEIRMTVFGGLRILDYKNRFNREPFSRPRLNTRDKISMLRQALFDPLPQAQLDT